MVARSKALASGGSEAGEAWSIPAEWSPELLKSQVYARILLDIILGVLPPGERLDEQALCRRYDAGLAGVRDALGRLALEGLVSRKSRAGTAVAPLDLLEVRQAFEACRLIEPHCAALAAHNASAEDLCDLRSVFEGAEAAVRRHDARALVAMDQHFHAAVARAGRNAILARLVVPLQHRVARFWVFTMPEDTEERHLAEITHHIAVIDCIERRDAEGARAAMLAILGAPPEVFERAVGGRLGA